MKNTIDYIVVGAGLFGSAIARNLSNKGEDVLTVDSHHPMSASKCSFGVWKDGWVNKIIQEQVTQGMENLEWLANGIRDIEVYNMEKDRMEAFKQVDCSNILLDEESHFVGRISKINKEYVTIVSGKGEIDVKFKKGVIVAAGAMTPEVLSLAGSKHSGFGLDKLWGATLDLKIKLDGNRMSQWAPYKQSMLVEMSNGMYSFGDGATVKNPKGVDDPRIGKASDRLLTHLEDVLTVGIDHNKIKVVNEGLRPYLKKGVPDFINQHESWLWSVTGGAKNSTILCGYVGKKMVDVLGIK